MTTQAKWTQKQYFGVKMDRQFLQCDAHKGEQNEHFNWAKPDAPVAFSPSLCEEDEDCCEFCLDGDDA